MERRRCKVVQRSLHGDNLYIDSEVFGYFHCWEHYAEPIGPSLMKGGSSGGQYSRTYAIVELEDGSVVRTDPTTVIFIDEEEA